LRWGVFHHLDLFELISTLLVEGNIGLAAVQDGLVRTHALADSGERLNDPQAKLLSLHALVDGNVLDVPDGTETADELALEEDGADTDEGIVRAVNDDNGEVRLGRWGNGFGGVELGKVLFVACVWRLREHSEELEMAAVVVCRREWAKVKLLRQGLLDRVGDEVGGEEKVELSVSGEIRPTSIHNPEIVK